MSMPRRVSPVSLWLSLAAAAWIAGCGGATDERPRQAVSGEVKIDGEPLKSGMIQFNPTEPGLAVPGGAAVTDGKYAMSTSDGLVPGPYLVSVTSAPGPSAAPAAGTMPGDPVPPPKEPIPSIYNAKTELTAKVTAEGPNTFNYELKSKVESKSKSKSK
jgi:hypothetical protein